MTIYEITTKYTIIKHVSGVTALNNPEDVVKYMVGAFDERPDQEQFWCILLNTANEPIGRKLITIGLINQTQVHCREAFRYAVREGATNVIFVHNHPSGNGTPSTPDLTLTKQFAKAGDILDIPMCDHVIMTPDANIFCSIRRDYYEYTTP